MNDQQLLRYSRHILLDEIGVAGQERLRAAHALVVGAGGLGCPAALYLAASGVGKLTIADPDRIDLTNLQRQILYRTGDVGSVKVEAAAAARAYATERLTHRHAALREKIQDAVASLDTLIAREAEAEAAE